MKYRTLSIVITTLMLTASCGYTARDGELIGQAKKVTHTTPLICPDYYSFDISMGIMQNGTGSMSTQDMWFTIENDRDYDILKHAAEVGAIVKVKFDTRRLAICTEDHILIGAEIVK